MHDCVKNKDQFWSCDCIVKETLWNRSEKVDHLAYKYWCVLQGSEIWPSLGKVTSTVHRKMYMGLRTRAQHMHNIYQVQINKTNLPNIISRRLLSKISIIPY